ncbi:MAG: TauD/TfdA family dioxygenase [Acidimicrobiales bacterium]|nr:TauD/TfdA family dioxygenase [Acidimicrobiales bacterium]
MSDATTYPSFVEQLLTYLDRPHASVPAGPVGGPASWRGEDLAGSDEWVVTLGDDQRAELHAAVDAATATGTPTGELTAADFPLPTLGDDIARWRTELADGRGFLLVRGLPVHEWTEAEAEVACWCLGLHLGRPGAQNSDGDLLGHVADLGDDANHPASRLYRTNKHIRFHCDAADVVGLLCLRTAPEGGASRLVSSVAVFDQLVVEHPDLVGRLFEPLKLDSRLEDGVEPRYSEIPPCAFDGEKLRTFMHCDYFGSVDRHEGVELTDTERQVLDVWEEIAERPEMHLDMDLVPGDFQLASNHTIVHARTGYVDADDPADRRHLLRLWLSL